MISRQLLDVLACTKCRQEISYDKRQNKLICSSCMLKFKILKGDVPDMLIEDAEKF